ncbi:MAG: PKD domain-containing protein, partial [Bacteroidales bacterium]|nr:PKD domain-containing protein [Bacteroidales bacterium]
MKINFITGLILLLPLLGFPQGEWNNWYFGTHAGITFNTVPPISLSSPFSVNPGMLTVSISDSLGDFLFYSDGLGVYNKNLILMPNGGFIFGINSFNQPAIAFPMIGEKKKYYLFTATIGGVSVPNPGLRYSMQMGPDGKIYIDNYTFRDSLSVIHNPSSPGLLCNFQLNAVSLNGNATNGGLSTQVQKYNLFIHHQDKCNGEPVQFSATIWPHADSVHWNFGDPPSGTANFSTVVNPTHVYSTPGSYVVGLFVRYDDNRTDTTWQTVTILPSPQPTLGPDQTILQGNSVTFDAGFCAGCNYQWSDLTLGNPNIGTGQTYTTGVAGVYMVSVTNAYGCIGRDTIQLTVIPNNPVTQNNYEYWFAAPAVTQQTIPPSPLNWANLNRPIKLFITTAEGPATVTIDQPANPTFVPIIKTVNNDSAREVDLTPFIDSIENKPANTVLNRGLHIASDKPISAIYEVQSPYNAATYSIYGKNALGFEFIIPAQTHFNNYPYCDPPARNSFEIVAAEDSTIIHIVPKQAITGHAANDTFSIVLNRGQTWSGRAVYGDSTRHLGGSFVFSNKPVAVTVTDDAVFINETDAASFDIVGDQLYPRHLCGTEFIPIHYLDAFKTKLWVYAFEDGTHVTLIDTLYTINKSINRGETAEFILDFADTLIISMGIAGYLYSNKPVLVYEMSGKAVAIGGGNHTDQCSAAIVPPITCAGSKRVCLPSICPFAGPGALNEIYWLIVTKNGNQGYFHNSAGFPVASGGFRTVPGTNGEYVFGISSVNSNGGLNNLNMIFTNDSGRFQLSAGSATQNYFINNFSYAKYSYFTEYSKLYLGLDRQICPGDSVMLDAGYGMLSYLWSTGATSRTIWVKTPGDYWVQTIDEECTMSDTIAISFYPFTPVNLGQNRIICAGDSVQLNAGAGRAWYIWSNGETTQTIWAKNPGSYWVTVPDVHCIVSDTVVVSTTTIPIVTNNPPLSKPICTGESTNIPLFGNEPGIMFHWTAMLVSGDVTGFSADSGLVINQILINNGATAGVVTYHITPRIGDCNGTPVDYVVTVNVGDPVDVSIAASGNTVCAGTMVTFTATPVNPGANPFYQWKVNAVNVNNANNAVCSYTPANGDVVQCILTSSNTVCTSNNPATSNAITMVVNPVQPVSISIAASANPFCAGSSVTFTATPVNGGTVPVYQWKVNAINVNNAINAVFIYSPLPGDLVSCVMTSSLNCVTANPVTSAAMAMTAFNAPEVTFSPCFDTITTMGAKPFKLKGGIPLGGTYSGAGVNSMTGIFSPSLAGTGLKSIQYTYTNVTSCSDGKSKTILVLANPAFTCGNSFTDIRDGKSYPTVQTGTQCWMAANLNYGSTVPSFQVQYDNCISEKYCYNDLAGNCNK